MLNKEFQIRNILKENKKPINDYKLIEMYFEQLSKEKNQSINEEYMIEFVEKYAKGDYPLAYLIGFELFGNRKIFVNNNTLIPRMETEEVVHVFIEELKKKYPQNSNIKIADICTGSGCIIVLIDELIGDYYNIEYYASDISIEALKVAKKNFETYKIKVNLFNGDLLKPLIQNKIKVDAIISNPPYIDINGPVDENVVKYEPHLALFAPNNGMECYYRILNDIDKVLNKNGILSFEIGNNQKMLLQKVLTKLHIFSKTDIIKDISGNDRIAIMELK